MPSPLHERLRSALTEAERDSLERILVRARADLDHISYTMGSGAPSTLKRALAVRMALEGVETPVIAPATGLSEARVEQVLENVAAHGMPALYPRFEEATLLLDSIAGPQFFNEIGQTIAKKPTLKGVRLGQWDPATLLDFLVHRGILEDASVKQIFDFILNNFSRNISSLTFSFTDVRHEQDKRLGRYSTLMFLLIVVGVWVLMHILSGAGMAANVFFSIFTLLLGAVLLKQVQEWSLLRKVLAKRNASLPAAPLRASEVKPVRAANPVPKINILHALSLPPTIWKTDSISDTSNALGEPPLRILYLWVFAAQFDQHGFETEGWPQLGPVHLLLNSTALTIGQLATARKKLLISDREMLDRTVLGYRDTADTYQRPALFSLATGFGKRPYRGYPIHTLVCNDAVWKPALHQMAERCDLAVINLSGYNPTHPGLEYEIRHLLAGGPPSRFLFLYERTTNADAVINSVLDLRSHLDSPPATPPELIFMRVPDSQNVGYGAQFVKLSGMSGQIGQAFLDNEGEYVPIAGQALAYLNQTASPLAT